MKRFSPFLFLFLLLCVKSSAQDSSFIVNTKGLADLKFFRNIEMAFVPKSFDVNKDLSNVSFKKGLINNGRIQPENIGKKILIRFSIANELDTAVSYYFFPGFFFDDTRLFRLEDARPIAMPSIAPNIKDNISFRKIDIAARDTFPILMEISQVKTYNNTLSPRLIHPLFLKAHLNELHNRNQIEALVTYIFCGLLIMMILFSLASYYQGSNREFLYYAAYALFFGVMLFTKPYYNLRSDPKTFIFEAYLDFIFQCIGICFYMAFMSRFLVTKKNYPFLHNLYKYGIIGLCIAILVFSWLHFGTDNFFVQNLVENYITKGLLLLMVVVFLIYAVKKWEHRLLRYLFWGNLLYFFFAIISLSLILSPELRKSMPGLFKSALVYYEAGIFLELAFFLMALTYKNRTQIIEQTKEKERLKMENERKELEKQLAVMAAHQEERNRISADMHDELGAGMTTIRLMSEIAKNKMKEDIPVEIEKISHSANDLLNKMNAIVWSMNSGNDTVDNLISYIRAYALEFLEGTSIHCRVNTPGFIEQKELSGDKRRNIFLCVKETLNNSLKHSQATEMRIDIETDGVLRIRIYDNGKGIDMNSLRQFGNGLKNIAHRMESIHGKFSIINDKGTVTVFELPL